MKKMLFSLMLLMPALTWAAAGDVWLNPASTTVALNTAFGLQMLVDSGTLKVGTYEVKLTYDSTKLQVDATTPISGGANKLDSSIANATTPGILRASGFAAKGVGPGATLHLITANFKCLGVAGSYPVDLTVENLTTESGLTIGAAMPRAGVGSTVTCRAVVTAPGDVWLNPVTTSVALNTAFGLQVLVDSGTVKVGTYQVQLTYDPTKLQVDTSTATSAVTNGADALGTNMYNATVAGTLLVSGFDATGKGPGATLHLITANFKCLGIAGSSSIALTVKGLTTEGGVSIGAATPRAGVGSTITIGSTAPYPDFVITAVTMTPAAPVANGTFSATVTVKNQGTGAGGAGYLDIWTNQATAQTCSAVGDKFLWVGTLAAGATKTLTFTGLAAGSAGTKTLRTFVDSGCGTVETNEVNNQLVKAYTVSGGVSIPLVISNAATNITATSATLNGSVTSSGATASVSFDFGPTTSYGISVAATPSSIYSATAVAVNATQTGLNCGTAYHYRVQATNSAGTSYGADQAFVTTACIYTVTPTAGTGGTVSPSTAQSVTGGTKANFTVTPNVGYDRNSAVSGTCPPGTWNGNVWTTGAITANCTVGFGFTLKTYTVAGSAGTGGTVSPSTQSVNHAAKANFTVTPNSDYTRNSAVTGTCPSGTWNGSVWTTGTITANCSVGFSFTPIVNGVCGSSNGGTFTTAPSVNLCSVGTASAVTSGSTSSPTGYWNWNCAGSNGGTTANCAANLSVPSYTVTASANPVAGGSFTPETATTVTSGATTSFAVIPATNSGGYVTNPVVTGTCPLGNWGGTWNNVWTTGPITANCTVIFGFTAVNTWAAPPNQTVTHSTPFTLDVTVKSNGTKVGQYNFVVTFDPTKLKLDTTYQNATGLCKSGVCPGSNALANPAPPLVDVNTIVLTGYDSVGQGPGNDLQLLVIHFISRYVMEAPSFVTPVTLKTNFLATIYGDNIGLGARSANVNVSTGLCGDADGNTSVNIVDALAIARKVVGMPPPPTVEDVLADVNEDGRVAITDALHIARYAVGLLTPPEVCAIGQAF